MLNKVLPRVSFTNPMQNWRNMLEAKILVENFGIEIKQCQNYDQNQEAEYYSSNFDFNIQVFFPCLIFPPLTFPYRYQVALTHKEFPKGIYFVQYYVDSFLCNEVAGIKM